MFVPWFGPSLKNASLLSEFGPPGNFGGAISRWEFFQVVSTASLAQTHRCSTDSVEYASRRPGAALRGAQLEGLGPVRNLGATVLPGVKQTRQLPGSGVFSLLVRLFGRVDRQIIHG